MKLMLRWLTSEVLVLLLFWAVFSGWYSGSCRQGVSKGMEWALLTLTFAPIAFPLFGVFFVVCVLVAPAYIVGPANPLQPA
jgi:hypothetical protein